MIISMDAEKVLIKFNIHSPVIIILLSKLKIEKNFFCLKKNMYKKLRAASHLW